MLTADERARIGRIRAYLEIGGHDPTGLFFLLGLLERAERENQALEQKCAACREQLNAALGEEDETLDDRSWEPK